MLNNFNNHYYFISILYINYKMSMYNKLVKKEIDKFKDYEDDSKKVLIASNNKDDELSNTDDLLYYNFEVNNPANTPDAIELAFDVNRIDAIINTPTEYEYGLERFSCPATIPIYIEDQVDFPLKVRFRRLRYNADGTKSVLNTTEIYDVEVFKTGLPVNNTYNPVNTNEIENGVYDYEAIINALNYTLVLATSDIETITGQDVGIPPFVDYDPANARFYLYAPILAPQVAPPAPPILATTLRFDLGVNYPTLEANIEVVEIQFNYNLAQMFNGFFNWKTQSKIWRTMVLKDETTRGNPPIDINGVLFLSSTTQYDIRPAMNRFDKILFLTDNVSVKPELLGTRKDVVERQLFDYVISNRLSDRQQINFFPQYVKYANLQSHTELRQFTMRVYLKYRNGKLYPLKLQPNERFNAKIIFRKKPPLNVREV